MLRMPPRPDPASDAEWSRVQTFAGKLFEGLDRLGEAGGICRIAAAHRWGPAEHDRAAGQLQAVLEAIEAELAQLELRRRHLPRARRPG